MYHRDLKLLPPCSLLFLTLSNKSLMRGILRGLHCFFLSSLHWVHQHHQSLPFTPGDPMLQWIRRSYFKGTCHRTSHCSEVEDWIEMTIQFPFENDEELLENLICLVKKINPGFILIHFKKHFLNLLHIFPSIISLCQHLQLTPTRLLACGLPGK